MSTNRFFILASDLQDDRVRLSPEQSHQVQQVLRLRTGDRIVALDSTGMEYDVTLTTVEKRAVVGQVTASRQARGEPTVHLTLFQSVLAREKFEWVLQKGTEVGVSRFVPVLTERSLVRVKTIEDNKLDRWHRILLEAAEQSHRGRVPDLDQIALFKDMLSDLAHFDRCLIAATSGPTRSLKEALSPGDKPLVSVAVLIGPEGGFSDDEVRQVCDHGAVPIGLGPRILRTETAAVVVPALVLHELGELQS
ncbi:MAG: 16S rRNA (uracil(1498)-N(3))-methyltransferase [Phycisphaerae bacterium]|nr:16S rRNA (uracil(1498)-N(3))-methyltransferase [Phycisphaerae bacterium]